MLLWSELCRKRVLKPAERSLITRVLIEDHLSNFSSKRLLRHSLTHWHSMTASLV
jgi:hypothetical protein